MTDRQIKAQATARENRRVFEDMNLPRDIIAQCSNGLWIKKAWHGLNKFGWGKWVKV